MATERTAAVTAQLRLIAAIGGTIQELGAVPSGHLYARLMGQLDLAAYERIIDALVRAELIRRDAGSVLTWVGPAKESA